MIGHVLIDVFRVSLAFSDFWVVIGTCNDGVCHQDSHVCHLFLACSSFSFVLVSVFPVLLFFIF